MNIPILLTLLRIAAIPFFFCVYYLPLHTASLLAAAVFIAAGITDWLDGHLARRLKQVTPLGSFLDPLADKLLVMSALMVIAIEYHSRYLLLPILLIICREMIVCALREWMARQGHGVKVAVVRTAKIKTTLQMVAVVLLLASGHHQYPALFTWGSGVLYLSAFLACWTLGTYLKAAWSDLFDNVKI